MQIESFSSFLESRDMVLVHTSKTAIHRTAHEYRTENPLDFQFPAPQGCSSRPGFFLGHLKTPTVEGDIFTLEIEGNPEIYSIARFNQNILGFLDSNNNQSLVEVNTNYSGTSCTIRFLDMVSFFDGHILSYLTEPERIISWVFPSDDDSVYETPEYRNIVSGNSTPENIPTPITEAEQSILSVVPPSESDIDMIAGKVMSFKELNACADGKVFFFTTMGNKLGAYIIASNSIKAAKIYTNFDGKYFIYSFNDSPILYKAKEVKLYSKNAEALACNNIHLVDFFRKLVPHG